MSAGRGDLACLEDAYVDKMAFVLGLKLSPQCDTETCVVFMMNMYEVFGSEAAFRYGQSHLEFLEDPPLYENSVESFPRDFCQRKQGVLRSKSASCAAGHDTWSGMLPRGSEHHLANSPGAQNRDMQRGHSEVGAGGRCRCGGSTAAILAAWRRACADRNRIHFSVTFTYFGDAWDH